MNSWYVLSKIINYIKVCDAFEPVLRGHDKQEILLNPGVINFSVKFNSLLLSFLSKRVQLKEHF